MSVQIIIREVGKNKDGFAATVQFGNEGEAYEISITNPFSKEDDKRLEWYFEEWLNFPFTDKHRAKEAAESIRLYGEALFKQVFAANRDVIIEYERFRQKEFQLVIVGTPEFHALHWEALHDPNQQRPLSVEKNVVRKNKTPVTYRADVKPAPLLRVLLVTARPHDKEDVGYRTISRPLVEALEIAKVPAQIDMVRPGTFEALVEHLEDTRDEHGDGYYHIIHLDLHGGLLIYEDYQKFSKNHRQERYLFRSGYAQKPITEYQGLKAFLFFNSDEGANPVSDDDLVKLFDSRQIPIIILNACQSGKQVGEVETGLGSRMLEAGAQLVVAMGYSVTVSAAQLMMTELYGRLLDKLEPATAIRRARLELYHDKRRRAAFGQEILLEDWMLLVVYQNRAPKFDRTAFKGEAAVDSATYAPPRTTYGFVGRDVDILEIENRLLSRRNILLVRGMGGAGKTTLLHHLGWWWQKTHFTEQVFYFGYDKKAYHLPEIVNTIGEQSGLKLSGRFKDDRAAVLRGLKSTRHLLVLDNLESVTGEPLAVQNTLPVEAQTELREFLQKLIGGRTLLLLGSRSGEAWLRDDPLRASEIYELRGLDYEAQTELTEAVLKNVHAPRYPEQAEHQADFRHLLKLLGGYPLAMEVVLSNLSQATPAEIIARLQAADVNLDNQTEAASKTQSILKCIQYSHSNLSEAAQTLLLCLAPFTGVVNINWLPQYSEQLKAQPALAKLPYDKWEHVLQEALNWGLLQPHENFREMGYLTLQPIFPYFLKTRLNDAALSKHKEAIEIAFREYYNGIGDFLWGKIVSIKAQEKQEGIYLIEIEYENLLSALKIALKHQTSFTLIYFPISSYLETKKAHQQGLELGNFVLAELKRYPAELLKSNIGPEFIGTIDYIAKFHLSLMQYPLATREYKRALHLLDKLSIYTTKKKAILRSGILFQLGLVEHKQLQWREAEGYFKDALKIYIEYGESKSQAKTMHNLGRIDEELGHWESAKYYYKEVLKIFIELNDQYLQAQTLNQLGRVAQEQQEWDIAESYYKETLDIFIKNNDRYSQAKTMHNLGRVAEEQGNWELAEDYFKKALKICIESNDRYSQARTFHHLGVVAAKQRQWEAAAQYVLEAAEILVQYQDQYSLEVVLRALAYIWRESKDSTIPKKIGELLGKTTEEAEALLNGFLENTGE